MTTIRCDIVSAEHDIFSGSVKMVVVTGEMGELGIAPQHAPLITRIKPGYVRVTLENGEQRATDGDCRTRNPQPRDFRCRPGIAPDARRGVARPGLATNQLRAERKKPGRATLRGAVRVWTPHAPSRRDAHGSAEPRPTAPFFFPTAYRPSPFPGPGNTESRPVSPTLSSIDRSAWLRPPTGDGPAVHPYPPLVGRRSAEPSVWGLPTRHLAGTRTAWWNLALPKLRFRPLSSQLSADSQTE